MNPLKVSLYRNGGPDNSITEKESQMSEVQDTCFRYSRVKKEDALRFYKERISKTYDLDKYTIKYRWFDNTDDPEDTLMSIWLEEKTCT